MKASGAAMVLRRVPKNKMKGKDMKESLMYRTQRIRGSVVGSDHGWYGRPILGTGVSAEQVAQNVASELNIPVSLVLYIYRRTDEVVVEQLQSGKNVNLDLVGFSINLKGTFDYGDSGFDASRNALMVSAYAKQSLRDCLKGITPRNVTGGLKASIFSVMDGTAAEEGVITVPSKVLVGGLNIQVDANADEGVWLTSKKGEIVATPTILANTSGTMDLDFGELSMDDGEYVLEIRARSGASTDFAPAVAKRTVAVRKAV